MDALEKKRLIRGGDGDGKNGKGGYRWCCGGDLFGYGERDDGLPHTSSSNSNL